MSQTDKQKVGQLGEDTACKFLVKHGYTVLTRNYRRKWGEIDVVAIKGNVLHFIEVKTVSHGVSHGTPNSQSENYQPEENVHPWKRKRLARTIQTYLIDGKVSRETGLTPEKMEEVEWQVDILAVFLDFKTRKATIRITENIIL